jgi:tetratricopeptide (TPR) repeat protein
MSKLKLCLRHISEVFLYEYYCLGDDEYELTDVDTLTPHKERAKELMLSGNYSKSQKEWLDAHFENPVDMESILGIILCCKQLGDTEGEYSYTTESYNYCCTRAELAAYYRNLGWYYLEKYNPELSAACYLYSKYFEESQQADAELEFLEKAIGKKVSAKDLSQIQNILKEKNIPTEANPITLALLYKAAEEAQEAGDKAQALDCYRMVYDLTEDEEVGKRISGLS